MKTTVTLLFSAILTTTAAFGQVTILWNESVNGDLSGNSSTFLLQPGTNSIIGATEVLSIGNDNWIGYADAFTFSIPSDSEIVAIYIQIDKPNVWAVIEDATFSNGLAFDLNPSSGELLSQWGIGSISEDTYGMYLENFDHSTPFSIANYQLDFVVEPVPEPGTLGLLLLGAGVFTLRHCRKYRFLS